MKAIAATQRTVLAIRKADALPNLLPGGKMRKGAYPGGTAGTSTYFASIVSGSGLSYVADIYAGFASDMTFTAIDKYAENATVKVPAGALDDSFSLTAGQVYPVAQYDVNGTSTWVITEHAGIS